MILLIFFSEVTGFNYLTPDEPMQRTAISSLHDDLVVKEQSL
jgi:hypothetical protein